MPIYKIRDDDTGKIYRVNMDEPPTAEDVEDIFASQAGSDPQPSTAPTATPSAPVDGGASNLPAFPKEGPISAYGAARDAEIERSAQDLAKQGGGGLRTAATIANLPFRAEGAGAMAALGNLGKTATAAVNRIPGYTKISEPLSRGFDALGKKALPAIIPAAQKVQQVTESMNPDLKLAGETLLNYGTLGITGEVAKAGAKALSKEAALNLGKISAMSKRAVPESVSNSLKSERASITIAPILEDDLLKKELPDFDATTEGDMAGMRSQAEPTSFKQLQKNARQIVPEAPKQPILERVLKGIDNADRLALSEKHGGESLPLTKYAEQALISSPKTGRHGVATPLDLVGGEGEKAANIISKQKSAVGKRMGEIEDEATRTGINQSVFVDARPIKERARLLFQKKLGITFNANGNITPYAGMNPRDAVNLPTAKKVWGEIKKLTDEDTAENLNSAIRNVRAFVEEPKKSQLRPQKMITDNVVDELHDSMREDLYNYIGQQLDPNVAEEFQRLRRNYAKLSDYDRKLSDMLGQAISYTDESGKTVNTTAKGASIAKRAIQSNADSGAKALFNAVKGLTGVDLVKNSAFATIAMKAAGDPREMNMLKQLGLLSAIPGAGGGAAAAAAAFEVIKPKDKLKAVVDYYLKNQGKATKPIGSLSGLSSLGNRGLFGNERGAVGASRDAAGALPVLATGAAMSGAGLTAVAALGAKKRKQDEERKKAGGR